MLRPAAGMPGMPIGDDVRSGTPRSRRCSGSAFEQPDSRLHQTPGGLKRCGEGPCRLCDGMAAAIHFGRHWSDPGFEQPLCVDELISPSEGLLRVM